MIVSRDGGLGGGNGNRIKTSVISCGILFILAPLPMRATSYGLADRGMNPSPSASVALAAQIRCWRERALPSSPSLIFATRVPSARFASSLCLP